MKYVTKVKSANSSGNTVFIKAQIDEVINEKSQKNGFTFLIRVSQKLSGPV